MQHTSARAWHEWCDCRAQVSEEVAALMAEQGISDLEKSGLMYLSNDARARFPS